MTVTLSNIVTLITLVGSIVLTLGRALWLIAKIERQVEQLERDVRSHLESTSLHRTPDSELRWTRIEGKLDRLEEQLTTIVQAVARQH